MTALWERRRYLRWWPALTYDSRAAKRYARMIDLHKSRKRRALEMRRRMLPQPVLPDPRRPDERAENDYKILTAADIEMMRHAAAMSRPDDDESDDFRELYIDDEESDEETR